MGKRQIRVFRKDIFSKRFEMTGKLGHVILTDHVVHNGQIQDITEQHLFLLYPTRHTHTFALETIQEVIFDKETDF